MSKGIFSIVLSALLLIAFSGTVFASNPKEKSSNTGVIEVNLIEGVKSENAGLRVSSAIFLGDMHSSAAVIPLMRVLKNCETEEARIAAAVSLIKIGDARGIYAVKRAAQFDESQRVRDLCLRFYHSYKIGKV